MKLFLFFLFIGLTVTIFEINLSGCAQILSPTGGPIDSIPPKLVNSIPSERNTNFNGNKIILNFDEYIQLDQVAENVIVSPTPKKNPNIDFKFKTVTIKLKDTLLPNTTYSINFGNAIKDLNEGNPFRKYTYVFSTGAYIDSMQYSGKVIMAETGKSDSTLQVYLYKNAPDSAVEHKRPDYISRLDSLGNFKFNYLPSGSFKVYALKDGDGSKTYNSKSETFAFLDSPVVINSETGSSILYAYIQEKDKPKIAPVIARSKTKDIKFKINTTVPPENQDLLKPFVIELSIPVKNFNKNNIQISDTTYHLIKSDSIKIDSTNKIISLYNNWQEDTYYSIIVSKDFATDTTGKPILKSDTLKFKTKRKSEYGSLKLHFKNLELNKNPLLQFVLNNEIVKSYPLSSVNWSTDLITPNEYEIRILYDTNKNGKWDPGDYHLKKQPERVIGVKKKVTIRSNFDSDIDIEL